MTVGVGKYYVIEVVDGEATIHKAEKHSTTAVQFFKDLQMDLATCNAVYFQDGETHRQCTTRDIEKITCEVITGYETKAAKSLWGKWFGWLFNFFGHKRLLALRSEMMESPAFGWGAIQGQVNALLKSEPNKEHRQEIIHEFETIRYRMGKCHIGDCADFVLSIQHLIKKGSHIYNEMIMDILRQRAPGDFDSERVEALFDLVAPGNDQAMADKKRKLQKEFYKSLEIIPWEVDGVHQYVLNLAHVLCPVDIGDSTIMNLMREEIRSDTSEQQKLTAYTNILVGMYDKLARSLRCSHEYNDVLIGFATTVLDAHYDESRELAERLVELVDPRGDVMREALKEKVQERIKQEYPA